MLEIARYGARRRLGGTAVLSVLLSALAGMTVAFFPTVKAAGVDFEAYLQSLPPAVREAFGVTSLTSIEGFLSSEFYQFALVILMGLYAAYAGGRLVAAEVETGRIDLVLAGPVSRARLVLERYLSLVPTLVVVNLVVPAVVYGSVLAIGESISLARVAMVHLLALPYLLACGAVGLLLSVLVDRADTAQRAALGLVFVLFLVDSLTAPTDYAAVGALSPTRYYDPTAVLVHGTYAWADAGVLLVATVGLLAGAVVWFRRVDVAA